MSDENRQIIYDGFISYSWKDKQIAEQISIFIRRYRPPKTLKIKKDKIEVFRDTERLSSSSSLADELNNKLNSSKFLILLCSKSSSESEYVNLEVEYFLKKNDTNSIIFIGLEHEFKDNLTPYLKNMNINPLFIDLTNPKLFEKECLRIIAKIYNTDYNKLLREDERRLKRKRLLWLTSFFFISFSIFSIFAISKSPSNYWKEIELPIVNWPNRQMPIKPLTEIAFNKFNSDDILFLFKNAEFFQQPLDTFGEDDTISEEEFYIVPYDNNYNKLINNKNLEQNRNNVDFWKEIISLNEWIIYKESIYKEVLSLQLMSNFDTCTQLLDQIIISAQATSNLKALEGNLCISWEDFYFSDFLEINYSKHYIGNDSVEIIELIGSYYNPHDSPTASLFINFYRCNTNSNKWRKLNYNNRIEKLYPLDSIGVRYLIVDPNKGLLISEDTGKSWDSANYLDKRLEKTSDLKIYVVSNDVFILISDKESKKLNNNKLLKLSKNSIKDRWIKGSKKYFNYVNSRIKVNEI